MLLAFFMIAAAQSTSPPIATCETPARAVDEAIALGDTGLSYRQAKILVSAQQPFCKGWSVVTILSSDSSDGRWIFRRVTMYPGKSGQTITWASSRTCPQIFAALESLERLPIRFGLNRPIRPPANPRDDRPRLPGMVLDGVGYTIRTLSAARQPSGYTADVILSSNAGEVATWAKTMFDSIATCWSNEEPLPRPE